MSKYIGFDTLQLKTLRLLIEEAMGDAEDTQDQLNDLDARITANAEDTQDQLNDLGARVTALENAEPAE